MSAFNFVWRVVPSEGWLEEAVAVAQTAAEMPRVNGQEHKHQNYPDKNSR